MLHVAMSMAANHILKAQSSKTGFYSMPCSFKISKKAEDQVSQNRKLNTDSKIKSYLSPIPVSVASFEVF